MIEDEKFDGIETASSSASGRLSAEVEKETAEAAADATTTAKATQQQAQAVLEQKLYSALPSGEAVQLEVSGMGLRPSLALANKLTCGHVVIVLEAASWYMTEMVHRALEPSSQHRLHRDHEDRHHATAVGISMQLVARPSLRAAEMRHFAIRRRRRKPVSPQRRVFSLSIQFFSLVHGHYSHQFAALAVPWPVDRVRQVAGV